MPFYNPIQPNELDGVAALTAAERTPLHKLKDERDTEFVKRIVCAYMNAHVELHPHVAVTPPRLTP